MFLTSASLTMAVSECGSGEYSWISASGGDLGTELTEGTKTTIQFNLTRNGAPAGSYRIMTYGVNNPTYLNEPYLLTIPSAEFSNVTLAVTLSPSGTSNGRLTNIWIGAGGDTRQRNVYLEQWGSGADGIAWDRACLLGSYTLVKSNVLQCAPALQLSQERPPTEAGGTAKTCYSGGCLDTRTPIFLAPTTISNVATGDSYSSEDVFVKSNAVANPIALTTDANGRTQRTDVSAILPAGSAITLGIGAGLIPFRNCAVTVPIIKESCMDSCQTSPTTEAGEVNFSLCSQVGGEAAGKCSTCLGSGGIWTAVGCISTEPMGIVDAVVKIGVGVGGGIALLTTLVGGFLITTSQGDPKRIQQGKEMITASVIGILFVLFSVVILQFIGVTIFRLPGFGT